MATKQNKAVSEKRKIFMKNKESVEELPKFLNPFECFFFKNERHLKTYE